MLLQLNNSSGNMDTKNMDNIINNSKFINSRDLIISWHFFEIISSSFNINNINSDNTYKFTINETYEEKYKQKLVQFIQYKKNIVKQYKRDKNQPSSKEYFKLLGNLVLKEEHIKLNHFKTVPIFIYKNIAVLGIIFINNNTKHSLNYINNYNILYKKIFLININKSITRLNNINVIKGIRNSFLNKEYLENRIILENNYEGILGENILIYTSLLNILIILEKYSGIFEFKT